jgi:hypothetical protein
MMAHPSGNPKGGLRKKKGNYSGGGGRWTTTATTTDNEGNSERVHRSRRRSRPPVLAVAIHVLSSYEKRKITVANLTRILVLYHQRMSSLFRTLVAGAMASGSQRDTEVTIGLCVCGLAEGDLVLHKSVNR